MDRLLARQIRRNRSRHGGEKTHGLAKSTPHENMWKTPGYDGIH